MIKLPHNLTNFKRILIKPYFIDNRSIKDQQLMPNISILTTTQISHLKTILAQIFFSDTAPIEILLTKISLIKKLSALSTALASLALVKQGRK